MLMVTTLWPFPAPQCGEITDSTPPQSVFMLSTPPNKAVTEQTQPFYFHPTKPNKKGMVSGTKKVENQNSHIWAGFLFYSPGGHLDLNQPIQSACGRKSPNQPHDWLLRQPQDGSTAPCHLHCSLGRRRLALKWQMPCSPHPFTGWWMQSSSELGAGCYTAQHWYT